MLRQMTAPLLALILVCAACSSTTVIQEGMLASPAPDVLLPAAEPEVTTDEPDVRGDRDLGDTDADDETDDSSDTPSADDSESTEDADAADDFGLGGDEQIQSLITDCQDGSDMACDILYSTSPVDSPAEEVALSCGGRSDEFVRFCTEGIESAFGNVWFAESSPGLPAALASCEDGDMTACDFLYFRSAVGSEYEEIGNTCGGRTVVALPDCRTAFGS